MGQFIANGLVASATYVGIGLSFLFVFVVCRRFDLSLAAIIPIGAYCVLVARPLVGLIAAIALGILVSWALGYLSQLIIYAPVSRSYESGLGGLLASFGVYLVLQNLISGTFSDYRRSIRTWVVKEGFEFIGARLTTAQIVIVVCGFSCWVTVMALAYFTSSGQQMRAVANDPDLSRVVGIDVERTYRHAMGLGGALAGAFGILIACDVDMTPTMGMQPLMMGVSAVIIAGNTPSKSVLGALLLGMAQHIGVIWVSTKWQDSIGFLALLAFLLVRRQSLSRGGIPLRSI